MSSEPKNYIPQIRAEKSGNRNQDDFRVLIAGVILCIVMIFGQNAYLVNDSGEPFCSNVYDPANPTESLTQFLGDVIK